MNKNWRITFRSGRLSEFTATDKIAFLAGRVDWVVGFKKKNIIIWDQYVCFFCSHVCLFNDWNMILSENKNWIWETDMVVDISTIIRDLKSVHYKGNGLNEHSLSPNCSCGNKNCFQEKENSEKKSTHREKFALFLLPTTEMSEAICPFLAWTGHLEQNRWDLNHQQGWHTHFVPV